MSKPSDIMEVLKLLGDFSWACRRPHTDATDEEQAYPPIITFRYTDPTEERATIIREAVATFRGEISWHFSSGHKNWVLEPSRIPEYTQAQGLLGGLQAARELMVIDPAFGRQAHDELTQLAEHLRQYIQELKRECGPC